MLVLLVGMDLLVSLPIMGATYRPFSWMSVSPADVTTLYPVIQNLEFENGQPRVSIESVSDPLLMGDSHSVMVLQRSTNLMNAAEWTDVASGMATGQVIHLIDTNPLSRAVFYRVKHILSGVQ